MKPDSGPTMRRLAHRRSARAALALLVLAVGLALLGGGAAAQEEVLCMGEPATIVGTIDAGERLVGTPGRDVIVGTVGDDVIRGGGGDDLTCAGPGNDRVFGGAGADVVVGGPGNDEIYGDAGNDLLYGGDGNDALYGGAGNDRLYGGSGDDLLYGEDGNDAIWGEDGNDLLYGGPGNDRLRGGGGDDETHGGPGDDLLRGMDGGDYLFGDDGDDLLYGGRGDDLLYGGAGADALCGGPGYDELWGSECSEIGRYPGHFCRPVPGGRLSAGGVADPGDLLDGGGHFDACNCDACNQGALTRCETRRGWRIGAPWNKDGAEEWRRAVTRAFRERAEMVAGTSPEVSRAVVDEIEHAMQIVACESLGDPFQVTPSGPAGATVDGLFQHKSIYWDGRAGSAGIPGASPFSPLSNARAAAWLVVESIEQFGDDPDVRRPAWVHWHCDEILTRRGLWE